MATYTTHGHEIPGLPGDHPKPEKVSRCGGPSVCAQCAEEFSGWVIPAESIAVLEGTEYYNEGTLFKVYESLRRSGLSDSACRAAVNQMQNDGILFRERDRT